MDHPLPTRSPVPLLAADPHAATLSALRALLPALAEDAAARDRDGSPPAAGVALLAGCGLLAAPLPRALGGLGWGCAPDGAAPLARALRLVGRASLPLGRLWEGHVNALRLVAGHGDAAQCGAAAADARAGRLFGVWNTERPPGLRLAPDGATLVGGKAWCSGAGLVERALVTARPDPDGTPVMVLAALPPGTPRADLSAWTPTGMRASLTGDVDLTGLPADGAARLGVPGVYYAQPGFSGGAWRFLAVQLGGIEALAEAFAEHLRRTGRGGDPHQRARLGRVLTAAEGARLWVEEAARRAEAPAGDPARVVAHVDLARGAVERAGLEALEAVQRGIGLSAFLAPHPAERIARDLATYLRQPAPDAALDAAAAHLLDAGTAVGDAFDGAAA